MTEAVVDIPCDVQQVDGTGFVWAFLDEARDPRWITAGTIVVTGDSADPVLARVVFLTAGLDTAPLLKGLPGDACPCPHWGYVFKGRFVIRYTDHEEGVESGDAFYMAPGHVPVFVEDTEMFEVSPADELRAVLDVVNANVARLDEQLWEQRSTPASSQP